MNRSSNSQQKFEFVNCLFEITSESKTPDFEKRFQIKEYSKGHLETWLTYLSFPYKKEISKSAEAISDVELLLFQKIL